jgi:Hsp20/alpha crystallin family
VLCSRGLARRGDYDHPDRGARRGPRGAGSRFRHPGRLVVGGATAGIAEDLVRLSEGAEPGRGAGVERPYGTFSRQVFLGETLDAEGISADYAAGVLTLTVPVREAAKPRSIQVTSSDAKQAVAS